MLQRLAAWCYRRRRSVVVLWIVALVAMSIIGSNVGSTFSQGFSLTDTESARAAQLLETRFPARAGDEGQIVFAHEGGVQDAAVQRINDYFNNLNSIQGSFEQVDSNNKHTNGRFYVQRPGKLRFDYAPPSTLRLVADGHFHDLGRVGQVPRRFQG